MPKSLQQEQRAEWAEKIRQQRDSGLNATSWCRKHQIPHSTFVYWKDCLSSKAPVRRSSFRASHNDEMIARVSISENKEVRVLLEKDCELIIRYCKK